MAIAASGAVSFSDLRTEFSGAGAISFSDLYRGGTLVKGNAANNSATNLAASVPASGTINFTNFRGAARGWRKTFASGATNQNASTIFGSDYGVNYPKEIVINSGVTLGATSTSEEALEINSGGIGSITVTNNGTLIGAGGAAGAAGGDAFEALVSCTFVNNGYVYAGGGGGGNGGTGGNGSYTVQTSTTSTRAGYATGNSSPVDAWMWTTANWSGVGTFTYSGGTKSTSYGGHSFSRGTSIGQYGEYSYWRIIGTINGTTTNYSSGGAGGSGGVGAGYNQSAIAGGNGASGGTNAGAGGAGGTGGGYGATGSNGSSGANGNSSNGFGGSSGGAAGKYIRGFSFVTFTNNGTVAGGTA